MEHNAVTETQYAAPGFNDSHFIKRVRGNIRKFPGIALFLKNTTQ
jgi:hypothetical protein